MIKPHHSYKKDDEIRKALAVIYEEDLYLVKKSKSKSYWKGKGKGKKGGEGKRALKLRFERQ